MTTNTPITMLNADQVKLGPIVLDCRWSRGKGLKKTLHKAYVSLEGVPLSEILPTVQIQVTTKIRNKTYSGPESSDSQKDTASAALAMLSKSTQEHPVLFTELSKASYGTIIRTVDEQIDQCQDMKKLREMQALIDAQIAAIKAVKPVETTTVEKPGLVQIPELVPEPEADGDPAQNDA